VKVIPECVVRNKFDIYVFVSPRTMRFLVTKYLKKLEKVSNKFLVKVSAAALTTGRMIPSETNSPPAE
jgi:hypothetical protein